MPPPSSSDSEPNGAKRLLLTVQEDTVCSNNATTNQVGHQETNVFNPIEQIEELKDCPEKISTLMAKQQTLEAYLPNLYAVTYYLRQLLMSINNF